MFEKLFKFGAAATNTNLLPLSILPLIVTAPFVSFIFCRIHRMPLLSFWTFLFLLYSFLSAFIYSPSQLLEPQFYRYDGNIFVTFLPFVYIPIIVSQMRSDNKRFVVGLVSLSIFFGSLLGLSQYATNQHVLGLFYSVNGFTGLMMILLCFSISYSTFSTGKYRLFYIGLTLLGLSVIYFGQARASGAGLILAFIYLRYISVSVVLRYLMFMGIVICFALILNFSYPIYLKDYLSAYDYAVSQADTHKSANLAIRIFENWPRGLHLFLNSPLWGSGFGSINDGRFTLEFFKFNLHPSNTFNSAHAHNSYLNILGELGVVGILLFFMVLKYLLDFIDRYSLDDTRRYALKLGFWALFFASLAEHRWPSPSNILPFVYLLTLSIGTENASQLIKRRIS